MTKLKRKLILGTITALASYLTTRKLTQQASKKDVEWISGEAEETKEPFPKEPLPMFYEGDSVLIYSPYTAEFVTSEWDVAPEMYEIVGVNYDEEEEVFRYLLEGGGSNEWYSEDWLSLPTTTTFIREWVPKEDFNPGREELTMKMEEIEQSILSKALDDSAKQTQIDYLLDRMNSAKKDGKAGEVAEIERQLAEITKGRNRNEK